MSKDTTTKAYKAFNKDMKCRGFQYEVGEMYKHDGDVSPCNSGFHACENPFDCWSYYDITESRFAEVELSGKQVKHGDDSKIAAASITISAEISLPEYVTKCIEYLIKATKRQASSGDSSKQASSGDYSQQASSGDSSKQASSGDYSQQASSGYYSQQASSGYYSKQASSGYYSKQASSGDSSQQASSGRSSKQASSGDYSKQASSGHYSKQASSGYYSQQASSGDSSKQASSGRSSKQASSGDSSKHVVKGEHGVIASSGNSSKAKGVNGTWVSLACFVAGKCQGFAVGRIGDNGLKPDTWYEANSNCELVEAEVEE